MLDRGTLLRVTGIVAIVTGAAACASADAQSAVPLATATPDDPPAREEPATLDVLATPVAEVLIDGKPVGKTPIKAYKVAPGSHDVTFVDETGKRTMTVNVEAGEGKTVMSDRLPPAVQNNPNKR